ncbi:MAG: replication factor C large subunit [Candidatus Micrarchaeia archaeon]|jgi:replication factor C large subunit
MLWTDKHAPKKLGDFEGNQKALATLSAWAKEWEKGKAQQPLILHGPPGTGKTALARAIAGEMNWGILEMNAGDVRNKDRISRIAGHGLAVSSLTNTRRLLLIDDAERMFASDRGGMAELSRLITSASQPLIFTAEDLWNPKLAPLRQNCKGVALSRLEQPELTRLLEKVAKAEKAPASKALIAKIASTSNGDARSAINDLQAAAEGRASDSEDAGRRDRQTDVKDALHNLFTAQNFADARRATFDVDVDRDMLLHWIDENVPREFGTRLELVKAFDALSRAALFDGRAFRRQYYALWRYSGDLMSAGVALSRKEPRKAQNPAYQFPRNILHLSRTRASRALIKSASQKIAAACHVSTRQARSYFPLISALSLSKDGRDLLSRNLGLEDAEVLLLSSVARIGFKK